MPKDLHELPKLRDSMSFLYVEHAIIEQDSQSIIVIKKDGKIPIPIASLTALFLGPGTNITHAAVKAICDNGCMIVWCGERFNKIYGVGMGETRSSENLLRQAKLCMDNTAHLKVVRRMYELRFPKLPPAALTLKQIRGMEGIRVKQAYKVASKITGVKWSGRDYKNDNWDSADDINKALSIANSYLYGICHAAIVSLGYSPGLGFIHTGKMLSFVYDVADFYKAETTIPAAFEATALNQPDLSKEVRTQCRKHFKKVNLLKRIPEDISWILSESDTLPNDPNAVAPCNIWDDEGEISGGVNYSVDW